MIEYFGPFSQARTIEVSGQGKVIHKTGCNRLGRFPEAASEDLLAGPKRNFQVFDPLAFLTDVTQLRLREVKTWVPATFGLGFLVGPWVWGDFFLFKKPWPARMTSALKKEIPISF